MSSPTAAPDWKHRVQAARTRMLFSHVPVAAPMGGALAVLMLAYVHHLHPVALTPWSLAWALCTLAVECLAGAHAVMYLRSRRRQAPAWRRRLLYFTGATGFVWSLLVWAVPVSEHLELRATLVGLALGVAACGAFMFTADRLLARLFFLPIGTSLALYCAHYPDARGLFGLVVVIGFMGVFWMSAERSHRRIGELLRLRFESEHLAQLRAAALDEARQLGQAKDMFLATMSHEMRTPLHGILGLSSMMQRDSRDAATHEQLTLIRSAGTHLLGVINDVLDLSRCQAGRLVLHKAPVDLHALVREVIALGQAQADQTSAPPTLSCTMAPDVPQWVDTDAHRLRQVLINLVGNAIKFTPGGQVSVTVARTHGQAALADVPLTFSVSDTGIGIPPSELTRIFDPFHQVHHPALAPQGTGLGLSIAQRIAQAMGGTLDCKSQLGRGSTFTLSVRVALAPAQTTSQAATAQTKGAAEDAPRVPQEGAHVLLVEDNPINAIVARATLEQLGLTVSGCENGREALDWLSSHHADLVLMDCLMPEMNGLDATRQIRAREQQAPGSRPLPIIALTASTESRDRMACVEAGMDDVLGKPFTSEELADVIARHLPQRQRRDADSTVLS